MPAYVTVGMTGLVLRQTINEMIDQLNALDAPTLVAALAEAQDIADAAAATAASALATANAAQDAADDAIAAAASINLAPYALLAGADFTGPITSDGSISAGGGFGADNVPVVWSGAANQVAAVTGGMVKRWSLTAPRVLTDGLTSGQGVILQIDPVAGHDVTWPAGVIWNYGSPPELSDGVYNTVLLWKVGTDLYGAKHGEVAL